MSAVLRRLAACVALITFWAAPLAAQNLDARLAEVLMLEEVAVILRDEGISYGKTLDRDMLGDSGGAYYAEKIARIYDPTAMTEILRRALAEGMTDEQARKSLDFLDTEQGHRILQLEIDARVAMADPAVDEAAGEAFDAALSGGDPRAQAVEDFIAINDLGERNVAGALSSNYQFLLGLVDGGSHEMSEGEILDEIWAQEDQVRAETRAWLNAFLFMAYGPLSEEEMNAYLTYSRTDAGQALNAALFDGFDGLYRTIYYALGLTTAQVMQGSEL